jgi:hypothetical protein
VVPQHSKILSILCIRYVTITKRYIILLCSVFTHFFIQCPLLLKCWFFFSVLFSPHSLAQVLIFLFSAFFSSLSCSSVDFSFQCFFSSLSCSSVDFSFQCFLLFALLLKCWFFFSVLSSLRSLAQFIKLCSSFVNMCMLVFCFWSLSFLWVFVLVLLCSVLCLLVFWLYLVAYILFLSFAYLSFICVFLLAFLFQICFEGGSFWSHYPSNIYDTTCSFGHTHYPRYMYHTTSHFALKVFFSGTWSTCSLGHTILAIFYHTSIHFALKVFFSDILS